MSERRPSDQNVSLTRVDFILLPMVESERRMAIRYLDWSRIRRNLEKAESVQKKPISDASGWYFFCFGFAGSAFLSVVANFPSQGLASPVQQFFAILTVASICLGLVIFRIAQQQKALHRSVVRDIIEDMNDIERSFDVVLPASPSDTRE